MAAHRSVPCLTGKTSDQSGHYAIMLNQKQGFERPTHIRISRCPIQPEISSPDPLTQAARCRRMRINQRVRWTPKVTHCIPRLRAGFPNKTFAEDHAAIRPWANRPFRTTVQASPFIHLEPVLVVTLAPPVTKL